MSSASDYYIPEIERLSKAVRRLTRERDAAREALATFGVHGALCDGGHPSGHYSCTCGLTAALDSSSREATP